MDSVLDPVVLQEQSGSGVVAGRLLFLLEGQLHQAQILAGLNQNQWAFIQHHGWWTLARNVHGLGLGCNRGLHDGNLVCIGIDPLQTRSGSQFVQLLQRQLIGLGLDGDCRRSLCWCSNNRLRLNHGRRSNGSRCRCGGFNRRWCDHSHCFCYHGSCLHFCSNRRLLCLRCDSIKVAAACRLIVSFCHSRRLHQRFCRQLNFQRLISKLCIDGLLIGSLCITGRTVAAIAAIAVTRAALTWLACLFALCVQTLSLIAFQLSHGLSRFISNGLLHHGLCVGIARLTFTAAAFSAITTTITALRMRRIRMVCVRMRRSRRCSTPVSW